MRRMARVIGVAVIGLATGCSAEGFDDESEPDVEDVDEVEEALENGFDLASEQASLARHNKHRHNHVDAAALDMRKCLKTIARKWAKHLAESGDFEHNPNFANQISNNCPWDWKLVGENIAKGGSEQSIFQAWLDSAPHHDNIDHKPYRRVGIGAYRKGDTLTMVVNFADPL